MSVKTTPDQHQSNLRNVYGTFTIEGMTISKDIRRNLDRIGSGQSSYQQVVNVQPPTWPQERPEQKRAGGGRLRQR